MASRFRSRMGDDLDRLVRAIGDCKSKTEEDRILYRSIEKTKALLKDGKVDKTQMKDLFIKLIYFEMLGHDASFGHFMAVQGCGQNALTTKMVAYLAVAQFLDSSNSLILLLVNTWRTDLQSDNHIIVCTALTAVCKLVNVDSMGALLPQVQALLTHPKEVVRKKAVMALHRFYQLDPKSEGALAGVDLDRHLRQALCDKDPSVMAATLCTLYEMVKVNPPPFRNLIPSLMSILKQVCEHRLNKAYEYHHVPAPFIQIKLLKILGELGAGDRPSTENMRSILLSVLRQASMRNTIGHAVLYECVRTITTVSPDPQLLEAAARTISVFLKPDNSHNLKYMGIDALGGIVRINPRQAQEHQAAVMDCLEDPDDTLKLKTLDLLYKMTKPNNVEIVVEKLLTFLASCPDEHIQRHICDRVSELAERYAPDTHWYMEAMTEMFEVAGDAVEPRVAHNLMRLIAEQEDDVHNSAVEIYLNILEKNKLPEILLQVTCWVLGEYGCLVCQPGDVMDRICGLVNSKSCTESLKGYILTAISKMCSQTGCSITPDAEELVRKAAASKSTELQQRALELQSLLSGSQIVMRTVLPTDGSCEDLENEMGALRSLSFLEGYVQQALEAGAAPYVSEEERHEMGVATTVRDNLDVGSLRYEAYERPTVPEPTITDTSFPTPVGPAVSDMGSAIPIATANAGTPQLTLRTGGTRRWGPAQFSAPEPQPQPEPQAVPHPTPAPVSPVSNDFAGLSLSDNGQPEAFSARDKLTASLFGDTSSTTRPSRYRSKVGSGGKGGSASPGPEAPAPSSAQPEASLLDLGDEGPQPSSQPSADPFASLEGVDLLGGPSEAPPQTSAPPTRPPIDLDALYGNVPTASNPGTFPPGAQQPVQQFQMPGQFPTVQSAAPPQYQPGMATGGMPVVNQGQGALGGMAINNNAVKGGGVKLGAQKKEDPFGDLLS